MKAIFKIHHKALPWHYSTYRIIIIIVISLSRPVQSFPTHPRTPRKFKIIDFRLGFLEFMLKNLHFFWSCLCLCLIRGRAEWKKSNQSQSRGQQKHNNPRDGNYSQWRNKNNQKQKFSSMMFFLANTQKLFQRHIKKLFFYRKCIWKFSALFFFMPRHGTQKSVVFIGVGEFSPHFPCFLGDSEPPSWCAPAGECLQSFEIHYGGV